MNTMLLPDSGTKSTTRDLDGRETEFVTIDGVQYRRHPRGGGLVALTATVAESVLVAPDAIVRGNAVVVGVVRLFDHSVVEQNAVIIGMCTLRDHAHVGGDAVLRGSLTVSDHGCVDGVARLSGSVQIRSYAHVSTGTFTGGMTIS